MKQHLNQGINMDLFKPDPIVYVQQTFMDY